MLKTCNNCYEEESIKDFHRDVSKADGVHTICKQCRAESNKNYRIKNKVNISKKKRESYLKNKDKVLEKCAKYYSENKEKRKAYSQSPRGIAVRKNSVYRRRAIMKKGDVKSIDIQRLIESSARCYWCNNKLIEAHIDHYIPLSKGGLHTLSNLVVSCPSCNHKKYSKDPIVFANENGRLL